jgi:hypothetical protein
MATGKLANGHSPAGLKLATNDAGTAALVWASIPPVVRKPGFVQGSVRLRNGAWLRTRTLSAADERISGLGVAVDRAGNVVAIWGRSDTIETAIRRAGSYRWSRPRVLGQGFFPSVAVDGRGNFVAAWRGSTGVEVRMRRANSRTWGPTQVVGTTPPYLGPNLAVGRGGMVGLAWEKAERQVPGRFIEATRLRPADGTWEPPRVISRGVAINPAIAVDQRGTIFVIWEYFTGGAGSTVEAVVRRATDSD